MNNHLPKNTTGNTAVIESLFTEMRERKAGEIEKKPTATTKKFEPSLTGITPDVSTSKSA